MSAALAMAEPSSRATGRPGTHQDNTDGDEWIRRLERPERLPGLKIDGVIAASA